MNEITWERAIQPEAIDAVRDYLSNWVTRLESASVDEYAEDERDEEVVLDTGHFPLRTANYRTSLMRRRTECEVRRVSCVIVSFKPVPRPGRESCVTVTSDLCRQLKVVWC